MASTAPLGVVDSAWAPARRAASWATARSATWVYAFVLLQIACQLALLWHGIGPLRVAVRIAAYGASLLLWFFLSGCGQTHPSARAAWWVLVIVGLSFFHPTTNGLLSGLAQVGMYLSILGPLFWVPRLSVDRVVLSRVLLLVWIFHTLSASFGVLQTYFPGRFQPNLSSVIAAQGEGYLESLRITLATGERVFRPMGLTDVPGGSAVAGFYATLFGIGFFLVHRRPLWRAASLGSMAVGLFCLYLSQVRSVLVMAAISMAAFAGVLIWRGRLSSLIKLAVVLTGVVLASFAWAVSLGGEIVTERLTTLIDDDPRMVYYRNRGRFLEHTLTELLPRYPLGAGLGRWGMTNAYFGDNSDPDTGAIWAEIQWTGWLLDGGVPLVLAYLAALALALRMAAEVASRRVADELWVWGTVLFAYNVGALAITFTYPFFAGQRGMEFWLLNAVLFAAHRTAQQVSLGDVKEQPGETLPSGKRGFYANRWHGSGQPCPSRSLGGTGR